MLPMFFEATFTMSATSAGMIAASFAFVNLFARPLGGYISDHMTNRKRTMIIYMVGIALGFFGMSLIAQRAADGTLIPMFEETWWLVVAVGMTISCSMFVQGAEGATFAIIPMIHKSQTGQIAGMAGAYENVGAVCYLVLYSLVDSKTFFFWLAVGATVSVIYCMTFLKEPKGAFADE
jgi:NNP family nitrate/nitrite transporter-like MFS transporter